MNEIYKFAKGKPLNSELVGIARFELLITDANGSVVGTVNPTLVVYAIGSDDDAYISNRLHGSSGMIHYGEIESFSLELREEHGKGKIFTINNDDTGCCLFTEIFVKDVNFTPYGHALLDTYLGTGENYEVDNSSHESNSDGNLEDTDYSEPYNPLASDVSLI